MKDFIGSKEVADFLGISQSQAYKVIRALNNELEERGFYTARGRVSSKYLKERYGVEAVEHGKE